MPAAIILSTCCFTSPTRCCLFLCEPHDRRDLAQRVRRGVVRVASAARRIRRVGVRTQGHVEHVFLAAHADGVCAITREMSTKAEVLKSESLLPARAVFFRARPDEQADGRHAAVRVAAAGFLAAGQVADFRLQVEFGFRNLQLNWNLSLLLKKFRSSSSRRRAAR